MSGILNQSMAPNGPPPAFGVTRAKGPTTPQDASQNLPMTTPLHGLNPIKAPVKLNYSSSPPWIHQGGNDLGIPLNGNNLFASSTSGTYHGLVECEDNHVHIQDIEEFEPCSTTNFFQSLLGNDRLNPLRDVMGELERISLKKHGMATVTVTSALKLEQKQIDQITRKMQRLTGIRNVKLENIIDPSLIAGFMICYGNDGTHVIDLSVKGQLTELKAQIETSDQRREELAGGWSFLS